MLACFSQLQTDWQLLKFGDISIIQNTILFVFLYPTNIHSKCSKIQGKYSFTRKSYFYIMITIAYVIHFGVRFPCLGIIIWVMNGINFVKEKD